MKEQEQNQEYKKVELEMKKVLSKKGIWNPKLIQCELLMYNQWEERFYLLLKNEELTDVSLDAIYECSIAHGDGHILSMGRIKERYLDEHGKMLVFQIENGFYKNTIKSVDKREVE